MKTPCMIPDDFIKSFGHDISAFVQDKIRGYAFRYDELSEEEHDGCVLQVVKTLLANDIIRAGEHRVVDWNSGWACNLEKLAEWNMGIDGLVPDYYNKYPYLRWQQRFIKPCSHDFERNMLYLIMDWLSDKYMRDAEYIYEFGCGTGHHLERLRHVNPNASLCGLDWAESTQKIFSVLSSLGITSRQFDFFQPDDNFILKDDSIVYTVAALEQVGDKYDKFIDYLLRNRPKLCIHVEPITELMDKNNLMDYLSIEYCKKRNYLSGFLTVLEQMEIAGRIKILMSQRTYIGSLFIDGYSVVIWTPQI